MSEIPVHFRGAGSGVGELTWGQLRVWRTCERTGRTLNLVIVTPVERPVSAEAMASALRVLVSRHPVFRTRLRFVDGRSGSRHPLQVVAESGELPLRVLDIGDGDDADAVAEELRARWERTWFDYEHEFPIRMGVVQRSGNVTHMVVCYSHVMVDGGVLAGLTRELLEPGDSAAPLPSPLELARAEGGPVGRRQSERSLRYWAEQIELLPARGSAGPVEPREPRYWVLLLYSPAMELGLRAIAARKQVLDPFVLLAAYAVAVARVLGKNPAVALPIVNNRFRPGLAGMVSQLSQPGIIVVDVADATFDQVVDRTWKAAMRASWCGYYDPVDCDRLLDDIAARRGEPLDIWWNYNDRRGLFGTDGETVPNTEAELLAAMTEALPRTEVYWDRKVPVYDGVLFVEAASRFVWPLPDLPGGKVRDNRLPFVFLTVTCDTHRFAPSQIEALAREMESVVVAAALDPATATGISRPPIAV
jgi:hypothetical protein